MKKKILTILCLLLALGAVLSGCGNPSAASDVEQSTEQSNDAASLPAESATEDESESGLTHAEDENEGGLTQTAEDLVVCFGDEGEPFIMHLYDNETAAAIAGHVGTSDWRLPIYHYDDYDNWEVMQYYDIPNRYEIPSASEQVTEEKAGEVYYSDPNRIILFYQDAEISAEYTPIGYFEYTEEFLQAVRNNPVLEGWGNKIVSISDGE